MDAQLIEADEDFLVDDGKLQDLESQFERKGEEGRHVTVGFDLGGFVMIGKRPQRRVAMKVESRKKRSNAGYGSHDRSGST